MKETDKREVGQDILALIIIIVYSNGHRTC